MSRPPREHSCDIRRGVLLVAASAVVWSFGGMIARFVRVDDNWTIVFWRSLFAAAFLLAVMLVRDGPKGTLALLGGMGSAGLGIALCFAVASPIFIVALAHTTVANILLMQAGGPLWVWLAHGEVPGNRTLLGGSLVILALVAHLAFEWRRQELS